MASPVYWIDLRATYTHNLLARLDDLLDAAGLAMVLAARDLVAVKLHFGELGATAYVRPVFLRQMVAKIKTRAARPFLTDTTTLYSGTRNNAPRHLETALRNGFDYSAVAAPLVIADGLRGANSVRVPVAGTHFSHAALAADIVHADTLVCVSRVKGHELCGFGATLKNLGMGCAALAGKLALHSGVAPRIKRRRCVGCGLCVTHCAHGALALHGAKAHLTRSACAGCGQCLAVCPHGAMQVRWDPSAEAFQQRLAEYAAAVAGTKPGKALFVNVLTNVSPACDCVPYSDAPIVRDIGFLAATDPVALDQASVDLVNAEPGLGGGRLAAVPAGTDKFRELYPSVDWQVQLDHAAALGLGGRAYRLQAV